MTNTHVPASRLLWLFVPFLAAASLACFEVLNDPEETNPVGTEHTISLLVTPTRPDCCGGVDGANWEATFEIISGPNAGLTTEDGVCSPCSGTAFDEPPGDSDEANWTYQSNGIAGTDIIHVCVIFTNGPEEEVECTGEEGNQPDLIKHWIEVAGNLIIEKSCPNGAGDGDADFNIVVSQLVTAFAADSLDCGEPMVVDGLDEGTYTIREFITGPNANDFLTAIVCATADGQTVTPGLQADVEIEAGADTHCTVINVFDPSDPADPTDPSAPAAPTVIVPIDLFNNNNNALNNNNTNDNNNENTNTQEQSNFQEQTNDNNQTTTVNSSPSVVIDFDD